MNQEKEYQGYVGVFDSGVGGLSVLAELTRLMPQERFLYFGDSANAPYGNKPEEWVHDRAFAITEKLLSAGVKAVVIACNTATAAAVADMRRTYPHLPVIGIEPALKVAVNDHAGKHFLVMATTMTLQLEKYHALERKLHEAADFTPLPCRGLAARIEKGDLGGEDLHVYLKDLLGEYAGKIDGVVLGCTHYPLIRKQIRRVLGDVPLYDGGAGTAREVRRRLLEAGTLAPEGKEGCVVFRSSRTDGGTEKFYRDFYELALAAAGEEAQ